MVLHPKAVVGKLPPFYTIGCVYANNFAVILRDQTERGYEDRPQGEPEVLQGACGLGEAGSRQYGTEADHCVMKLWVSCLCWVMCSREARENLGPDHQKAGGD